MKGEFARMMRLPAAFLALALSACADTAALKDDPVFQAGYDVGCTAAHGGYAREDWPRLTAGQPELFRRGFSAGYGACGGAAGRGGAVLDDPAGRR